MDDKFTGALKHERERKDIVCEDVAHELQLSAMITESVRAYEMAAGYFQAGMLMAPHPNGVGIKGVNLCRGCLTKALQGVEDIRLVIEDFIRVYDNG